MTRSGRTRSVGATLAAAAMVGLVTVAGCSRGPGPGSAASDAAEPASAAGQTLAAIRERGALRVATRNAPTIWYLDRHDQSAGPEYDLVAAFAAHLDVEIELVVRETPAAVLDALDSGEADLAAAGLTAIDSRAGGYLFGPSYRSIKEQLVCRRGGPRVRSVEELSSVELVVPKLTSYVETLEALAAEDPRITFELSERGTEQLLEAVEAREIECTVADSHIVAMNRRYLPGLSVQIDLSQNQKLVWMMAEGATSLQSSLLDWFLGAEAQTLLREVEEHYYAVARIFDYVELQVYQRRLKGRYPKYAALFEQAGETYGISSALLAAQAYQESQWDPKAKSPTGVRGIMMLTQPTAKAMGVKNRLDPGQSIDGGAKYLARMRDRFDESIPEPDRTYLALAAYNVGRGHMHDAQSLTRERGGDPKVWLDVKETLPLLADKSVYPSLKYGYARGTEPVRYVERIRNYEDILLRSLREERDAAEGGAGEVAAPTGQR
jgi:membrane-bound lytic murein transglycosylase F